MEPREPAAVRYRLKIDHARHVERVLQWLGWTVAVLATTSPVGFVGVWMPGGLTGGQAVGVSLGTIVGSILSLAFYALMSGGMARTIALAAFALLGISDIHHVIEAIAKAGYDPGVVTSLAYCRRWVEDLAAAGPPSVRPAPPAESNPQREVEGVLSTLLGRLPAERRTDRPTRGGPGADPRPPRPAGRRTGQG